MHKSRFCHRRRTGGTTEGKSAAKKTIKMEKTVEIIDGFQLYKTKNIIDKLFST